MKRYMLILCIFLNINSFGQLNNKLTNEIGYFIYHKDYNEALRILELEKNKDVLNPQWNFFVGQCQYLREKRAESFPYLKLSDSLGYKSQELNFYLGDLFQVQNEFSKAKDYFVQYIENINENKKNDPFSKSKVEKRILECENGIQFRKDSKEIEIINLGNVINSKYPDYAPVISADEQTLFFTSRRPNSTGGLIDGADNWNMEDIYFCEKDSNNQWSAPDQLPGYINSNGHDADIGLSPDGQKLFIYRDDELEEGLAGNIYVSDWKYKRWSTPTIMPEPVNTAYWETGVSITPDEKTLYFSSNRPGGYGGLDIYSVRLLPNGDWARAQNLGPTINTAYNEESPFIHPDERTLYFSSEGHNSMGGFDVFYSTIQDSKGQHLKT